MLMYASLLVSGGPFDGRRPFGRLLQHQAVPEVFRRAEGNLLLYIYLHRRFDCSVVEASQGAVPLFRTERLERTSSAE